MSRPLELDYIGLTETTSPMERSSEEEKPPSSSPPNESLNLKETELRLGLPGSKSPERKFKVSLSGSKRGFSGANVGGYSGTGKWGFSASEVDLGKKGDVLEVGVEVALVPQIFETVQEEKDHGGAAPAAKAQVVGWPPIRSFRKNTMATNSTKNGDDPESKTRPECLLVKVSLDGAPYLRKVDLKLCSNYMELSSALEKMFSCFTTGQCSPQGRDGLSKSRLMDLLHGSEYVLTYEDKDRDLMLVGDVPWEMFTDSCKRLRIMKGSEAIGIKIRNK